METSPLRYLDYDVSQMLCEQVRLSQEEEARKFHDNLFHYGEKMNQGAHDLIVSVYSNEQYILDYSNIDYMNNFLSDKKYPIGTCIMIKSYYEAYIDNTRLHRCHRRRRRRR